MKCTKAKSRRSIWKSSHQGSPPMSVLCRSSLFHRIFCQLGLQLNMAKYRWKLDLTPHEVILKWAKILDIKFHSTSNVLPMNWDEMHVAFGTSTFSRWKWWKWYRVVVEIVATKMKLFFSLLEHDSINLSSTRKFNNFFLKLNDDEWIEPVFHHTLYLFI